MGRFQDLTVLITGAAGGFGLKLARRFAAEGANLVLSDLDAGRLDEATAAFDTPVATLAGNVADESLSQDLVALAFERFGRLDVAVNNAGIVHDFMKLPQTPSDVARRVFEVDLLGMFFALKHQIPALERQFRDKALPGAIVNMASVAGIAGAPKLGVYAAAKHGVVGLTRSAAAECATKGVRINAVCPSFARTAMVTGILGSDNPAGEAELTRGVPMRRLAETDEIAEVVLFAADPKNSFMTGQTLAADGGITAI
ncbi:MAG: SDR family oxidoreductase [Aquamicrobium sp.]|uniref:SDR family NAD(P)-dependent oxidoreductase n=1 Tax=Aquamicrobium sp. TaxID=1872579 RepID=UPI00349ECFAD|nr:SDR family oxidoreductase [Aquamicrobium sp.]